MSKMSNLNQVLDEMITAGQKMIDAANELKGIFSDTESSENVNPEVKTYTFQEVRGIMASLAGKGKKAEAKALLTKYGATRLSDVNESEYPALVADAEVIANG